MARMSMRQLDNALDGDDLATQEFERQSQADLEASQAILEEIWEAEEEERLEKERRKEYRQEEYDRAMWEALYEYDSPYPEEFLK